MCNNKKVLTIWIFGLSGSGKTTFATELIAKMSGPTLHLDGDTLRGGVCADLGFSNADRASNISRSAHIAKIANAQGISCVVSMITPNEFMRDLARDIVGPDKFRLVYISTPLEVCQARDSKGLYARNLRDMTGTAQSFEGLGLEEPSALVLNTDTISMSDLQILAIGFVHKECL